MAGRRRVANVGGQGRGTSWQTFWVIGRHFLHQGNDGGSLGTGEFPQNIAKVLTTHPRRKLPRSSRGHGASKSVRGLACSPVCQMAIPVVMHASERSTNVRSTASFT